MTHHRLVAFYLMSSFLYYNLNRNVLSDDVFDGICKRLAEEWDGIEHQHKCFIPREDLLSGTGYSIKEYPQIVEPAAMLWEASTYLIQR